MTAYQMLREPRHETLRVRGLDMHLTRWGPEPSESELPVFLLHGWLDSGETFQFMVDALQRDWPLVALDWRGFGRSEWPQQGYWFPDYFGDLDALLDLLSPAAPARIVGHSMGGNIACSYAGIRPERVRCLVNLEGFGLARTSPEQAPARMRKWLHQLKAPSVRKEYASFEELAGIIRFRYPRFSEAQAAFVARAWGKLDAVGQVRLAGDPRHHWVNPVLYKREDTEACWRELRAPLLMLMGEESDILAKLGADGTSARFRAIFPNVEIARIPGAGHMLHIERPDLVARLVESFLDSH
ncbi:MAG TPA: alpha/beta hydrolase [Steroidobacteraceae bacterium]|nr:alpha/beta hydrolase [Steroidobacteraceae bacterium]